MLVSPGRPDFEATIRADLETERICVLSGQKSERVPTARFLQFRRGKECEDFVQKLLPGVSARCTMPWVTVANLVHF